MKHFFPNYCKLKKILKLFNINEVEQINYLVELIQTAQIESESMIDAVGTLMSKDVPTYTVRKTWILKFCSFVPRL